MTRTTLLTSTFIQVLILFLLSFLFLASIQFSVPTLADFDSYYHVKVSDLMGKNGMFENFKWIRFSTFHDSFVDLHFGAHLLLIPFTLIGNDIFWSKVATVLFASLVICIFFLILQRHKISYAFFWSLFLLVGSEFFVARMSMTRLSIHLSLLFSFLAFHFIISDRPLALASLSFVYTWSYSLFFLPFLFATLDFILVWIVSRKRVIHLMVFSSIGILLGLLINPFFPKNLMMLYQRVIQMGIHPPPILNQEWQPISLPFFLYYYRWFLLLFAVVLIFIVLQKSQIRYRIVLYLSVYLFCVSLFFVNVFYLLLISCITLAIIFLYLIYLFSSLSLPRTVYLSFALFLLFLVFQFLHLRVAEYFVPFSILFLAFFCSSNMATDRKTRYYFFIVFILLIFLSGYHTFTVSKSSLTAFSSNLFGYEGCAQWLLQHTPTDSHVFLSEWHQMPLLFYYDDQNVYTVGLDLGYLYYFNETLYQKYMDVKNVVGDTYGSLTNDFHADYLFFERVQQGSLFFRTIEGDLRYKKEYDDQRCSVYQIT